MSALCPSPTNLSGLKCVSLLVFSFKIAQHSFICEFKYSFVIMCSGVLPSEQTY